MSGLKINGVAGSYVASVVGCVSRAVSLKSILRRHESKNFTGEECESWTRFYMQCPRFLFVRQRDKDAASIRTCSS